MYEYAVAFIGIFIGCLSRMLVPYLQAKPDAFDYKYFGSLVSSLIFSFIVSSILIQTVQIGDGPTSLTVWFASQVLEGWGATDIFNKVGIDWRKKE